MSTRTGLGLSFAVSLALLGSPAGAQNLPAGFVTERLGTQWEAPIALAFLDEHRLLVAERTGRVWYVDHGVKRNLVYDLVEDTQSSGDRGLLGLAVGADFDLTGWIYLLHTVRVRGGDYAPTYSRLVRVRAEFDAQGALVALPDSREILFGDSWPTGIPACVHQHALGSVRVLSDGSVVLATGDSATGPTQGGNHPDCFGDDRTPLDQDLGAFRAQYENSPSGKLLRVDAATGLGLPDNPYFTGDPDDLRSRIYALGFRNPFRFTVIPDSGPREALLVADVGYDTWEEVNLCLGGENFGWPCFEGSAPQTLYLAADALGMCAGIQPTAPLITWHHTQQSAAGFVGQCASALCVYRGTSYPETYHGRLFFMDFARNWIRAARLDDAFRVQDVLTFGGNLADPVELVAQPGTGDLVYVSMRGVLRIRYVGAQRPPVALVTASPTFGPGDLDVTLSAEGSSDPDGQPLSVAWDLGDGTSATGAVVEHHYPVREPAGDDPADTTYLARATVRDAEGLEDSAEVRIHPGNTPPRIVALSSPTHGGAFVPDEPLRLAAEAEDTEDGTPKDAVWTVDLVHDHHVHPGWATEPGLSATFVPESHGVGDNHFVVRLTVGDSGGLTDERSVEIFDPLSTPRAHLVDLPAQRIRVGQVLSPTGHVDDSYGEFAAKPATLTFDWGDGTSDVFPGARHHVDTRPSHTYRRAGRYELRLVAERNGPPSVHSAIVDVTPPWPAVAVFAPLDGEHWIAPAEALEIVGSLETALAPRTSQVRAFHLGEGSALTAWMQSLASDSIPDVIVLLGLTPAPLLEGGFSGSPLERWLAGGNGVVWSGSTPFHGLVLDDGSTSQTLLAADTVFAATSPYVALGEGVQRPTALAAQILPSLTGHAALRAVRLDQLGPAWRVARLFAVDSDQDSDAVELQLTASRGFYAQFLCSNEAGLPRAAVLSEYLANKLGTTRILGGGTPVRR